MCVILNLSLLVNKWSKFRFFLNEIFYSDYFYRLIGRCAGKRELVKKKKHNLHKTKKSRLKYTNKNSTVFTILVIYYLLVGIFFFFFMQNEIV